MDEANWRSVLLWLAPLLALGELAFPPHPNHHFILDLIGRLGEDDHGDSSG